MAAARFLEHTQKSPKARPHSFAGPRRRMLRTRGLTPVRR